MTLNEKIELVANAFGGTNAEFADKLGINKTVLSHILNNRNKPSLDVIQKIVAAFPFMGYDWINDDEIIDTDVLNKIAYQFSSGLPFDKSVDTNSQTLSVAFQNKDQLAQGGRITKIVVFYDDNTFTEFQPCQVPS